MKTVRRNLAANLIGGVWNSALSLLFIPVYLRYLGVEAYGLIGFYATLQAMFGLFDLGLGATLNRGLARLSVDPRSQQRRGDLLRTFEVIYHGVAVVLGVLLFAAAPFVAQHWVHVQQLPLPQVITAIRLMAVLCALQFPSTLYQAGLLGLQRHVLLNVIAVAGSTLRAGGAVLVLMFVSRSLVGFFAWQAVVTGLHTVVMLALIWRILGRMAHARFDRQILRAEWRFAASLSANSLVGAFITQADKVILSGMAPLKELGYYSLAATVAAALWFVILPVNTAVYPRFAQLLAAKDHAAVAGVFHKACQTIALLVLPAGVTLAFFAHAVVEVWTGDAVTAAHAAPIVLLLVIGTTLYGLSSVPTYLLFAGGWPHPTLYTNVVSAVIVVPTTVYAVSMLGAPGAALAWLLVNGAYFVPATLMFRRVIPRERRRWYVRDLGLPLVAATAAGVLMRALMPAPMGRLLTAAYLALSGAFIFAVLFAVTPDVRTLVAARLRAWIAPHTAVRSDAL